MIIAISNAVNGGSGTGEGSGGNRQGPVVFEWSLSPSDRIPKTIGFEAESSSVFPFTVFWGDGTETIVTGTGPVSLSYSSPSGSYEARFSPGAVVAPTVFIGVDEFLSFSNIVVGDNTFEGSESGFSSVTNLPSSILSTLDSTFLFGRAPSNYALPTNIGFWDVSNVVSFNSTFYNNPGVDDSFGQWTFSDSASIGPFTFNLMSNDDVSSCLVQWEANGSQGSNVLLQSTWSDDPGGGSRNPRQISESAYPLGKAAYDNLISNYGWSDSGAIIWTA